MPGKQYTAAEKAAMRRDKAIGKTGLGALTNALRGNKNAKGVQTASAEEAQRVRHRLELKYPDLYPGGGAAPLPKKKGKR